MGRNAKLSAEALPEGEERLLEDGVFPFSFGAPWSQGEPPAEGIDIDEDLRLHEAGAEDLVGRRVRLCHDLLRWYQAIGTPYGYYLFQALQAQSRLLQSCCLRITTHYPSFEFEVPIYPWFTANTKTWVDQVKAGDDDGGPLKVLVKSLRTWTSLDRAIGVLAGTTPLELRAVRSPIVLMDKWLGGTHEFAVAMPQGVSPDEPACPVDAGLPIGGNAVMSGAAKAAGFLYVLRLERAAAAAGLEVDVTPHYKASQFEVRTMAAFGEALAGKRPESEGALLTFLAASDLALFPPLHPMFSSLRDGVRWSDLHPGFRLRRISEVIKDRDLKLDSVDPWAYWRFASAICQALKWPEVTRFLDAVRAREKEGPEDHVGQMFRAACAERETNPCAFIDPFKALTDLGKVAPPATRLAAFESDADSDQALSFALEGELYAVGFQLLHARERPKFVSEHFREVLEQLDSAVSMAKTYYGVEL